MAEEILVPPILPYGMRDPSLTSTLGGSPVTMPARQGHVLPHQPGDSLVDGVEAEQRALQDKGFSDAAIRTILTATHDTS